MKWIWTIALLVLVPGVCLAQEDKFTALASAVLNVDALRQGDSAVVAVGMQIPGRFHAQSVKPLDENLIPFTVAMEPSAATLEGIYYPPGEVKDYPLLGKLSVYAGRTVVFVKLKVPADAATGDLTLKGSVRFQLCDDKTCFAPATVGWLVKTKILPAGDPPPAPANDADFKAFNPDSGTWVVQQPAKSAGTTQPVGGSTTVAGSAVKPADSMNLAQAIGLALLVGVIFNVMPCVLPVLPLKAVGFYESSGHDRAKTLMFGVVFSLGVIAVFAILATLILAGKSIIGRQMQWGEMFAHGLFVWTMVAVLVLLGFWLLGAFGVNLPTSIYGLSFRHDTFTGNFLWGGLTAILSTPCTAPLFPGLIAWAVLQPPVSGFVTLIAVGAGMALPYLILSAFPGLARKFPRTGPFAELFKQMMAFLLLGTAAFFVGTRVVTDPNQYWLVYAVAVVAAIFLIVRTRQILPSRRAAVVSSLLAAGIVVGGFFATQHVTQPSKGFIAYTPEAFAEARKGDHVVLVKFTASWCLNCKYVEQTVYHDDATLATLQEKGVILMKADLSDSGDKGWTFRNSLGGNGIPFTAIWPAGGQNPITLDSIYTSDTLLKAIDQAKGKWRGN